MRPGPVVAVVPTERIPVLDSLMRSDPPPSTLRGIADVDGALIYKPNVVFELGSFETAN